MKKLCVYVAIATALFLGAGQEVRADDFEKNKKVCEKEYKGECAERTACKLLGTDFKQTRDCLRNERKATGGGANDDTKKSVARHAKCWAKAARDKAAVSAAKAAESVQKAKRAVKRALKRSKPKQSKKTKKTK